MSLRFQRLIFIILSLVLLLVSVIIVLFNIKNNIVFFLTPSEAILENIKDSEKIRIGGLVKKNTVSLIENTNEVKFIITDNKYDISVNYVGILPDLFKEGSGVVAEGLLKKNVLYAEYIFAKHDENYMPDTIKKQLQESGRWKSVYK